MQLNPRNLCKCSFKNTEGGEGVKLQSYFSQNDDKKRASLNKAMV